MPLPSNENDLKRRARRRLIGAVALTLLAVIVLPLLLEDEPPPASSLAVRMAATPATRPELPPQTVQPDEPDVAPAPALPAPTQPVLQPPLSSMPEPQPLPKPERVKAEPVKAEPVKVTPKPAPAKAAAASALPPKPAAASDVFVVQLAALSDATKAEALMARAAKAGLPAFTDKVGTLTRVRVGPYPTRAAAVAAAVKLAENNMAGQVQMK